MRVHIIFNGVVTNTILVDNASQAQAAFPGATVVDGSVGGPGWLWVNDQLIEPAPTEVATSRITQLAFRNRFTQPEKVALKLASLQQTPEGAAIGVYIDDVAAATYIDLQREDTRAGVQALEAAGLLAAGRAAEILDSPVTAEEAYRG